MKKFPIGLIKINPRRGMDTSPNETYVYQDVQVILNV